jgi:hypothetical protein
LTDAQREQLERMRLLLEFQFGLRTEYEQKKQVYILRMLAPANDEAGNTQYVAEFYMYWLPQERRFYLQDKRYSTYAPLRTRMIRLVRDVAEGCLN